MEQIERIQRYETLLDEARELLREGEQLAQKLSLLKGMLGELDEYYSSSQWRQDYEDDEAGRLPEGLKRGVLSEDGIYNALEDEKDLFERIKVILG